ncbi:MAG: hypothetical protein N3B13_09150 [Deltaproteobacteria bacterium]|nr:hypothetical protein [Deltaproteobacteria bacterium]
MEDKKVILLLILGLSACLPKVFFNQSFSSPEKVPVSKDGYIALPSGENFDGSLILETEKMTPKDISIIKIHGTYLVVAEGFRHLWAVFPVSGDKAKVKRISILKENETFSNVVFEVSSKTRCIIFRFSTENGQRTVFVDSDGDAEENKCDDD